jgi:hypothetical protein
MTRNCETAGHKWTFVFLHHERVFEIADRNVLIRQMATLTLTAPTVCRQPVNEFIYLHNPELSNKRHVIPRRSPFRISHLEDPHSKKIKHQQRRQECASPLVDLSSQRLVTPDPCPTPQRRPSHLSRRGLASGTIVTRARNGGGALSGGRQIGCGLFRNGQIRIWR